MFKTNINEQMKSGNKNSFTSSNLKLQLLETYEIIPHSLFLKRRNKALERKSKLQKCISKTCMLTNAMKRKFSVDQKHKL